MNNYKDIHNYDWFDDKFKLFQSIVNLPHKYDKVNVSNNYKNIINELYVNNNKNEIKLDKKFIVNNSDEKLYKSHKYELLFSPTQHKILQQYYDECKILYNICVDVWKQYNNMSTSWQLIKDVIFRNYYRSSIKKEYNQLIDSIVNELKQLKLNYDKDNEKFKEKIEKLKQQYNDEYKEKIEIWKKTYNEYKKQGLIYKEQKPKKQQIKIEKEMRPRKEKGSTIKKPAPDDTLKAVIRDFCKDLQANRTKKINDNKFTYDMKYKNVDNQHTITISDRAIVSKGIFVQALGELKCTKYKLLYEKYNNKLKECTLTYDKKLNKYYINVVHISEIKEIKGREKIVALDPGEKIFMTFYSLNKYGKISENNRIWIIKIYRKIRKLQSILDKNRNKNYRRIKHKKSIKRKIHKLYQKIKNKINEIHKKTAKYLCENYERILIPSFETKPMISKNRYEKEKNKIEEIKDQEEKRNKMKKLNKTKKMSEEIKFVIGMESHYKFKEYLKAKAKEYRTVVTEIDESYTSKACSKCGELSDTYVNRIKICKCGYKIDRDINGARNILIKSIREMYTIG